MTHLTLRMISAAGAAAAAVTTLVMFSSVVAIAEPQRSALMAKSQHSDKAPVRVAMTLASNDVAKPGSPRRGVPASPATTSPLAMPIGLVGRVVGAELDAARHLLHAFERWRRFADKGIQAPGPLAIRVPLVDAALGCTR